MLRTLRPGHLMAIAGLLGAVALARPEPPVATASPWRGPAAERRAAPFPRAIDGVTLARSPQHIVAASVTSAEILMTIVPKERIAGVHFLAADPRYGVDAAQAARLPLVGAEPEQLAAVGPDLVVIDAFSRAEVPLLLAAIDVPVVRTAPVADFGDVADNIRRLGWATGCDEAAERLVAAMNVQLAALSPAAVAGWRVMNLNGGLDTYGASSLLDAAIRATGARNVPAEHGVGGYRKLDIETVLGWRADALIVGGDPGSDDVAWLQRVPGLEHLPCVARDRIVHLPDALLSSTSQHSVAIAERIQQALRAWGHP